MSSLFNRFIREEQGQDLVEYALLAGLISIASIGAITALGTSINAAFNGIATGVTAAGS
jgi:pilus assembly protein Flp/PilA